MQRYRNGRLGPGSDFQYVKDGQALLKVAAPPPNIITDAKWVVNVPAKEVEVDATESTVSAEATADVGGKVEADKKPSTSALIMGDLPHGSEVFGVKGYVVRGLKSISGPYAIALPGNSGAIVKVTEGMWEQTRGRKIDGGERRQAETRFKKRSVARRAEREAESRSNM